MPLRILFVDDNPKSMEPYREPFERNGDAVTERSTVEGALDAFETGPFDLLVLDLLVLDLMMPPGPFSKQSKAGLDTGKHLYLKAREQDRDLPIVIFSNVDDFVDLEPYEGDPNLHMFRKQDYRPRDFAATIGEILRLRNKNVPAGSL